MGMLLADWSVELFRARRRKAKKAKMDKVKAAEEDKTKEEDQSESGLGCPGCKVLQEATRELQEGRQERDRLCHLVGGSQADLVTSVKKLVSQAEDLRHQAERLKEEGRKMSESVGKQLMERDTAHGERVRALEIVMAEKERQLLQSANILRQQLSQAKKERDQLQHQLEERKENGAHSGHGQWEAECESLKLVLDIRREEAEQLKAANNSLRLELEKYSGMQTQLQVQTQRAEELGLVVAMKNDQLRQVLDEYDCVQQQLEVEVSAHLACQQELERSQWVADSILSPTQTPTAREKSWKNLSNQVESGLILDVVQKGEKGLAYSFNC